MALHLTVPRRGAAPTFPDVASALRGCRPTWVEVDLDALASNLRIIRERIGPERRVLAMVKADAYGHGAVMVSRRLEKERIDLLGVATAEEGLELREAGIGSTVLVLGASSDEQLPLMTRAGLVPTVYSLSFLQAVLDEGGRQRRAIPFHLKVDTGMRRLGLMPEQLEAALARLAAAPGCAALVGLLTHLSCSDDPDDPHTQAQLASFARVLAQVRAAGYRPAFVHAGNSGAILDHPAAFFDTVRPGLALYGLHPSDRSTRAPLVPALSFRTKVVLVRKVPAGTPLGYGHAFITRRESVIGTIAAGYADGLPRVLSDRGEALVRATRAPFAGRISMDHSMLDLTDVPGASELDEVVLVGRQAGAEITADEFALWAGTICYEAVCRIGPRVPRLHVQGGTVQKRL